MLSKAGERLFRTTRQSFGGIEDAVTELRSSTQRDVLSVDVSISFASCWLIRRLSKFRALQPDIDVRLVTRYDNQRSRHDSSDVVIYFCLTDQAEGIQAPQTIVDQ